MIAPNAGTFKKASDSIPHSKGNIQVSYEVDKKGHLIAHFTLPEGITGTFKWKGRESSLLGGTQDIKL